MFVNKQRRTKIYRPGCPGNAPGTIATFWLHTKLGLSYALQAYPDDELSECLFIDYITFTVY